MVMIRLCQRAPSGDRGISALRWDLDRIALDTRWARVLPHVPRIIGGYP